MLFYQHEDRGGGGSRIGRGSRRSPGSIKPSKTLFVINFDPVSTRMRDLERHFEPYGKIVNIRIRRNFAFVQYDSLDDASKAFEATNGRSELTMMPLYLHMVYGYHSFLEFHEPEVL